MSEERARMSSVLGVTGLVLGNVQGQGDFEVRGRVQGDIVLEGRVLVAAGGLVLGTIEALQITVSGTVRGDLIAEDGVDISGSGQVEGNVTSPRVAIEAGAKVRGHLRTGEESPVAVRGNKEPTALGERLLPDERAAALAEPPYEPAVILPPEFPPAGISRAQISRADRSRTETSPSRRAPGGLMPGRDTPSALVSDDSTSEDSATEDSAFEAALSEAQGDGADARGAGGKRRRRRRRGGGDRAGDRSGGSAGNGETPSDDTPREKRPAVDASVRNSQREAPRNEIIPPQRPTRPSGPLPAGDAAQRGGGGQTEGDAAPERPRRSKPLPTFVKGARGHLRN